MLGLILWDFDDLCMAFWHGDRRVFWKGMGSLCGGILQPSLKSTVGQQGNPMDHILLEFACMFDEPQGLPPTHAFIYCRGQCRWPCGQIANNPQLQKDELER